MKKIKDKRGFGSVETFLFLIIVFIVGFAGWYVWQTKVKTERSLTAASSTNGVIFKDKKPVLSTLPNYSYSGWKTFCSSQISACFKYDPSWTFSQCAPQKINAEHFQQCVGSEIVSLRAPGNYYSLNWSVNTYNPKEYSECLNNKVDIEYSDITKVPSTDNVYFLKIWDAQAGLGVLTLANGINGQPPSVAKTTCPGAPIFLSKDGKNILRFEFSYVVNTNPNLPASEQNPAPPQSVLDDIKQSMLSIDYK